MSGMDRLTDEALERVIGMAQRYLAYFPCYRSTQSNDDIASARELLAHRRASQAASAPSDGLREAVSDDDLMIFIQKRLANELRVAGWHDAAEYLIDDYMGQQIIRAITDCRNAYAASPAQEGGE